MRITAVLTFVLFGGLAAPAFGQSFVGTWTASADSPGGKVSETVKCVKTNDGYTITAKVVGAPEDMPQAGPGTDIVINGDSFSYKRTLSTPQGDLVITYSGVVSGDTFTATAQIGDFKVPYTGVRVAAGK
jgi:hypothetical protein